MIFLLELRCVGFFLFELGCIGFKKMLRIPPQYFDDFASNFG